MSVWPRGDSGAQTCVNMMGTPRRPPGKQLSLPVFGQVDFLGETRKDTESSVWVGREEKQLIHEVLRDK